MATSSRNIKFFSLFMVLCLSVKAPDASAFDRLAKSPLYHEGNLSSKIAQDVVHQLNALKQKQDISLYIVVVDTHQHSNIQEFAEQVSLMHEGFRQPQLNSAYLIISQKQKKAVILIGETLKQNVADVTLIEKVLHDITLPNLNQRNINAAVLQSVLALSDMFNPQLWELADQSDRQPLFITFKHISLVSLLIIGLLALRWYWRDKKMRQQWHSISQL